MTIVLAFDSETFRIGPGSIAPPMVASVFTTRDDDGELQSEVLGNHPDDGLEDMLEWMLTDEDLRVVTHKGGFDYSVICATFPRLIPHVYAFLFSGRATDTLWREKLLNLSMSGQMDKLELPDGSQVDIRYRLADLVSSYLGLDISSEKDDDYGWRKNFQALDGVSAADYPEDARQYIVDDGEHTLRVYEAQERKAAEWEMASLETQEFQLLKDFVLSMMSAWGMEINPEATEEMAAAVDKVLAENMDLLEREGILRPMNAVGRPYAKFLERAHTALVEAGLVDPTGLAEEIQNWAPYVDWLRETIPGIRFSKPKGKPGSKDMKRFQEYLAALYHRLGEIPAMTPGGAREPQIKCDAEVQEYLAGKDPVMAQYFERQALGKLSGQMIPMLRSGPVVHPCYDALKATSRTASFDGGKFKEEGKEVRVFPSVNIQQIPNEIRGLDPRRCFRPRAGRVFWDVDFTGLELACVGHVTGELFGESVHRDLYNAGVDLHGYLGAQLALGTDQGMAREFGQACRAEGILTNPLAIAQAFALLKTHEDAEVRKFFKHFRNFAKPVGLGFPGGLGPDTMVEFARKTYGVSMISEEAYEFREMWRATYPEMPKFFDWINGQKDQYNVGHESLYEYTTPLGMVRRGATFCAAANGMCMQSPGAEAALTAAAFVSRACYDPTQESILLGCRPIPFIHDQIIGETNTDPDRWADEVEEVARLMREGAEMVLHSIKMRTDEALLTTVWSKSAVPVRDDNGRLIPWTPQ